MSKMTIIPENGVGTIKGIAAFAVLNTDQGRAELVPEQSAPVGEFKVLATGVSAKGWQFMKIERNGIVILANVANLAADGLMKETKDGWVLATDKLGWDVITRDNKAVDVKYIH